MPDIARELDVDALVTGTVEQVGDSVSIRERLVDALPEEQNLWEHMYDRAMTDAYLINSEVARAISNEIKIKLTSQEETHLAGIGQVDPEAYEAYLKGIFHWRLGTAKGHEDALTFYHQAVEKDPTFPLAYSAMAFA